VLIPVVEKAKKENLPVRTPVWKWVENYGAQSYVIQEGVKTTGNVYVYPTWGKWGYDLVSELDKFIADANKKPGVAELIIMAGFVDQELFDLSVLNWERGIFISLLENGEIFDKIKKNFELVSFSDL